MLVAREDFLLFNELNPYKRKHCGVEEGKPLGHSGNDWSNKYDTIIGGPEINKCSICGISFEERNFKNTIPVVVITLVIILMIFGEYIIFLIMNK